MVVATETFNLDGTTYTVQVENIREYVPGVVAIDIGSKRDGSSAIISESYAQVASDGSLSGGRTQLGSPGNGRFQKNTVFAPASAGSITLTWVGEYGSTNPEVTLQLSGLNQQPVGVCDYTDNNGRVPSTIGGVPASDAVDAIIDAGVIPTTDGVNLLSAADSGTPIDGCVGSGSGTPKDNTQQGISPAVVGLGVLGVGAVAVALSQRDE